MRRLIYNYNWQVLRIGLRFTNEACAKDALERLKQYLCEEVDKWKDEDSNRNRIYRVVNMLAATKMGLNGQKARFSSDLRRNELDRMINRIEVFKNDVAELPFVDKYVWQSEEKQLADLQKGYDRDPTTFNLIQVDLEKRMCNAKREDSRPELENYLRMMTEVQRGGATTKQS